MDWRSGEIIRIYAIKSGDVCISELPTFLEGVSAGFVLTSQHDCCPRFPCKFFLIRRHFVHKVQGTRSGGLGTRWEGLAAASIPPA